MALSIEENREILGLPPRRPPRTRLRLFLAAFGIILCSWYSGRILAWGWQEWIFFHLQRKITRLLHESHPDRVGSLLHEIQNDCRSLAPSFRLSFLLNHVYQRAAEFLPHRSFYLEMALAELEYTARWNDTLDASSRFLRDLELGCLLTELGRDLDSLQAFQRAEIALTDSPQGGTDLLRLYLENAWAYLLAKANDPRIRDGAKALSIAKGMMLRAIPDSEGRFPSTNPALLDTLAEAYYAAGFDAEAVRIQRHALALAERESLFLYLRHYDSYAEEADLWEEAR